MRPGAEGLLRYRRHLKGVRSTFPVGCTHYVLVVAVMAGVLTLFFTKVIDYSEHLVPVLCLVTVHCDWSDGNGGGQ